MTDHLLLARCAPIAIAMAALPAMPAQAQDVASSTPQPAPVIVLEAAPAPVAPTIVLPEPTVTAPAPAANRAVAPETANTGDMKDTPAAPAREGAAAPRRTAAPLSSPRSTDSIIAPAEAAPVAAAPLVTVAGPAQPSPVAEAPSAPEPVTDNSGEALVAGLLAALGIGAGAFVLLRSRRRKPVSEAAVVTAPVRAPLAAASAPALPFEDRVGVHDQPVAAEPAADRNIVAAAPLAGGAVALPSEMPRSFEERDRLLRRLVAMKPDHVNPFRSPKARARRARLIMQSLGRDFAGRTPRFDLGAYFRQATALPHREFATT